jgi:hypothetical protein
MSRQDVASTDFFISFTLRSFAASVLALTLMLLAAGCNGSSSGSAFTPRRTATPTLTSTPTATVTTTATATFSPTATVTQTATASPTATVSPTATRTVTPTATFTATPTATGSPTPTGSATATGSPTPTGSASPTATPTAIACPGGSAFTIANDNSYPIWLAESYQGSTTTIVEPPGNNWEIAANSSVGLCMPSGWNGRFWPRTECNFDTLFANDPGFQSCTATSDCTVNNTADNPHICYGGKCMLTCNTGSTPFCQGSGGLDNNSATCAPVSQSSPLPSASPTPMVCTYPAGTVCKTGDCAGLYQCYGTWDSQNTALQSAGAPVSLFEAAFTGTATVNYDVSLVNGYNTQIDVQPSVPASGASCYEPSCSSDLNASCPANLQFTEAPTSTVSSIPCGSGTYCQSGACVSSTCVIGCMDPGDQCANNPPANLMCSSTLPSGATYENMYLAKNSSNPSTAMSSGNQADSTCWGDVDCPPDETCEMAGQAGLPANFPTGVGVCATSGTFAQQINCINNPADVGNSCGGYQGDGYPAALGYSCISTGSGPNAVACVPAWDPPVSGLGSIESAAGQPNLLTGVGSFINPDWLTASTQAGGGTTPYYETFANACPHQYGFSYDDIAGDMSCTSGGPNINFSITFGP